MITDEIRNKLETAIMQEHKRLYMALYAFLQYIGDRFEEAGLSAIKHVIKAGDAGVPKDGSPQVNAQLAQFLEGWGFVRMEGEKLVFDLHNHVTTLGQKMELSAGDLAVEGAATALFLDLMDQMTRDVALPPIRKDGIGLNRDLIFNRLRGHVRNNETGAFSKVILPWLV